MNLRIIGIIVLASLLWACKSSKSMADEEEKVPFNNKVLVRMSPETTADYLVEKYKEYSLSYKGKTTKNTRSVLFQFDDAKISRKNMLALLNKDKGIESASSMKRANKSSQAGRSMQKSEPVRPIK